MKNIYKLKVIRRITGIIALAAVMVFSACGGDGGNGITDGKAAGAEVSAPTLASKTLDSITINAVAAPANGQTVEYARSGTSTAPSTGWQDALTFSGLSPSTTYYIFARSKENATHNAGTASAGLLATTDDPKAAYYHSWQWDPLPSESNLITLTAGTFVFEDLKNPGDGFAIDILTWEARTSPDSDYPTGYKLTGTLTAANGYGAWDEAASAWTTNIGDTVVTAVFIHNDGDSIMSLALPHGTFSIYAEGPWNKQ